MKDIHLKKEDYEEPRCPFCRPGEINPIPTARVIEKLDEYLAVNDYDSAQRHLKYWFAEAQENGDGHGELTVLNELIGLYRKTGKQKEGLKAVSDALSLSKKLEIEDTVTFGTTLINAATALRSFEKPDEALPLYVKARTIYEEKLLHNDSRLGGLYNNMALTVMAIGDTDQAQVLFEKAIEVMSQNINSEAEIAITYCNLADLVALKFGTEKGEKTINEYLDKAYELLSTPSLPRNGYYAFVCEKCAPAFGYYGHFAAQWELNERARKIYERA